MGLHGISPSGAVPLLADVGDTRRNRQINRTLQITRRTGPTAARSAMLEWQARNLP
jgi:hypothetical protein